MIMENKKSKQKIENCKIYHIQTGTRFTVFLFIITACLAQTMLHWLVSLSWSCLASWALAGRRSIRVFRAVRTIRMRKTETEIVHSAIISTCAAMLSTASAYCTEARARIVRGNEYAHHAKMNFFIDFLNRAGLDTCVGFPITQAQKIVTAFSLKKRS